jgi:hypothetical protein
MNSAFVFPLQSEIVTTILGDVPEFDLDIKLVQKDEGESWVMTRTCVYKGSMYPAAQGQVVRQDVWVTMKTGLATKVAAG